MLRNRLFLKLHQLVYLFELIIQKETEPFFFKLKTIPKSWKSSLCGYEVCRRRLQGRPVVERHGEGHVNCVEFYLLNANQRRAVAYMLTRIEFFCIELQ